MRSFLSTIHPTKTLGSRQAYQLAGGRGSGYNGKKGRREWKRVDSCGICRAFAAQFRSRWKAAFPTILFFVVLFLTVSLLFGSRNAMVVSSTTTLFQIRRKRNNTGTYYIKLLFITLLLGMLAYLASRNVVLCVLLNFTVPFALVFFQSDQFAPKGYFGYAMTFVFLELRPPTPEEFPVQMLCLLFCTLVLIGALLLYARLSAPSAPPEEDITRGLTRLAELLEELAGGGGAYGARRELEGLARAVPAAGLCPPQPLPPARWATAVLLPVCTAVSAPELPPGGRGLGAAPGWPRLREGAGYAGGAGAAAPERRFAGGTGSADRTAPDPAGRGRPCLRGGCVSSTAAFSTACSCCWRRESPGPGGPGCPGGRYLPAAAGG